MVKTWFITGTSSGFGKELATLLAQKGDVNLVATARHTEQLDYLNQYDHGQILKATLDVTKKDQVAAAVKSVEDKFSTIDVLINNAGLGYFATIEDSNENDVRYMFDVNVFGLADMTKAVLPLMRNQKSGRIINFSSALGLVTMPTMGFYSATKFAVEGYSEALNQEVSGLGIKVSLVEPSGFRTDWSGRSSKKVVPKEGDYSGYNDMISANDQNSEQAPGDPKIAAQIIYDQATSGDMPEHLPLGQFAVDGSRAKFKKLTDSFDKLEKLAYSADNK
ncbi:oxidoreductase [Companilactobacillus keshanensis]|uniref:Oxidoreductase n=1 Tax=Companilactobacillus keshanensis TaxID=2486003 RepID=A0ABW4BTZ0_9LACO|nr:oxidoreductase [Companilactobacillus keshanensis]